MSEGNNSMEGFKNDLVRKKGKADIPIVFDGENGLWLVYLLSLEASANLSFSVKHRASVIASKRARACAKPPGV